ncbi:fructose-bisphosphate aldolase / 2-amino-3,7-dideoxy-D-threo-hept-6-ulosonate synthase [Thermanaeromonas toyohensis ToBE]|uniref:Fructose-bisphosphate aldolase / 2-amino-3,7-dideoxy-D-threo-hept-6-ulosonate synthase n=1 Tax=Thermanaeromonas toyohensis ToBE TaxID=698762 RepID=A0A1W1V8Y0_9FIRM|nr:hypothetical protein [Thermanaeromonas toyohensis]SMB89716.1 fructose-bisphosphate aldolase / 2-amino-3,7-dideoxy-D-threo-hept-6-ulosonate synthase [Thermanaeromonas toyohensis ToBE]
MTGQELRLRRLFPPEGALIVALDHGLFQGLQGGPEDPVGIIRGLVSEPITGLLLSRGLWKLLPPDCYTKALLLRVDAATSFPDVPDTVQVTSAACALRLGADGILTMGLLRQGENNSLLRYLGLLTEEAHANGLPAIVELMPRHDSLPVRDALRISAELGFDAAKIFLPLAQDEFTSFVSLIGASPIPVAVAGGQPLATELKLLELVREIRSAGAAGLIFGRNIWSHPQPRAIIRSLSAVWQGDLTPREAYDQYLGMASEAVCQ